MKYDGKKPRIKVTFHRYRTHIPLLQSLVSKKNEIEKLNVGHGAPLECHVIGHVGVRTIFGNPPLLDDTARTVAAGSQLLLDLSDIRSTRFPPHVYLQSRQHQI